jgi:hypothetical protein
VPARWLASRAGPCLETGALTALPPGGQSGWRSWRRRVAHARAARTNTMHSRGQQCVPTVCALLGVRLLADCGELRCACRRPQAVLRRSGCTSVEGGGSGGGSDCEEAMGARGGSSRRSGTRGAAGTLCRVADDAVSLVAAGTSPTNTPTTFTSLPRPSPTTTTLHIAAAHTQSKQAHTRSHAVA